MIEGLNLLVNCPDQYRRQSGDCHFIKKRPAPMNIINVSTIYFKNNNQQRNQSNCILKILHLKLKKNLNWNIFLTSNLKFFLPIIIPVIYLIAVFQVCFSISSIKLLLFSWMCIVEVVWINKYINVYMFCVYAVCLATGVTFNISSILTLELQPPINFEIIANTIIVLNFKYW